MLQTHPPYLKGPPTAFQEQVPDAGQAAAAPDPGPGSGKRQPVQAAGQWAGIVCSSITVMSLY